MFTAGPMTDFFSVCGAAADALAAGSCAARAPLAPTQIATIATIGIFRSPMDIVIGENTLLGTKGRILVALVATAAALVAPAGAGAKLLDDYYNEGLEPQADLGEKSRPISQPRQLRVEFSGSVPQLINGEFSVSCYVRGRTRFSRNSTVSGVSPVEGVVPIKGRFDTCRVTNAEARFADPFISGWLRIRIFGTPR